MATLILGALEEEIAACRERLTERQDDRWHEFLLSAGVLSASRVAVARTGVGKTMSALGAQHWIDALAPERVLFVGTAGALGSGLEVGDVVVGVESLQYDLDARAAGFELGSVPLTEYRIIESEPRLVAAAMSYPAAGFRLTAGRVLTGDRVLTGASQEPGSNSMRALGGAVVEMEGASVALVCRVNAVPFLLLRFVSDRVDGTKNGDFRRVLPLASARLLAIVEHLLSTMREG